MTIYFYFFVALSFLVILTNQRLINLPNLFFAGNILYGLPLFFGGLQFIVSYKNGLSYDSWIEPVVVQVYVLGLIGFLVLAFFDSMFLEKKLESVNDTFFKILVGFQMFYTLVFLSNTNLSTLIVERKSFLIDNPSVFYFFSTFLSALSVLIFTMKKKQALDFFVIIPSIMFLLFDLYLGYRTTTFLLICSVFLALFWEKKIYSFKERLGLSCIILLVVTFAFLFKPLYYSILEGDFKHFYGYMETALVGSEPFVIMGNFNELVRSHISLDSTESYGSIAQYIPLSKTLFGIERFSTNTLLQKQIFNQTEWGIASTGYGSLYISYGIFGVFVYLLILIVTLIFLKSIKSTSVLCAGLLIAPYFFFYFHRNDWHYALGVFRLFGACILVPLFVFFLFSKRSVLPIFSQQLKGGTE